MSRLDSESQLIREAVAGDRTSLSQLLLLHYDDLSRHVSSRISRKLQGLVRADDILQMTFLRAAQAVGNFQPHHAGAFRGWLRTIADNLVRDAEKRRRRERRLACAAGDQPPTGSEAHLDLLDAVGGGQTTPGRKAQRHESIRHLQAALAGLPDDQREIVRRRYLQGQSLEQIAEATGRTKDAVRSICYRARRDLRACMGRTSLYFSS